ncbi:hypothetical protein Vi05172_g7171 [Venturia inaequalis]|nr:hypothetical protein Vi05172_g7171 [Venturia inaequalis]
MVLSSTAALPIILSLLATQSMAQVCHFGPVNSNSKSWTRGAACTRSLNDNNVFACGPSGASIVVRPARPQSQIIAHAGSSQSTTMMVTCDGKDTLIGCQAGATTTLLYPGCFQGVKSVEIIVEH